MPFCHERKHRLPRECYQGLVTVSFTACVDGRRTPFMNGSIVRHFLTDLQTSLSKNQCLAPIYCFMPDHLHVIVSGQGATADTWRAMVDFKQKAGFWFRQQGAQFSWQKDFHDPVLRANEDLAAHVRYIAANPVRRGLVKEWWEYAYTGTIGFELKDILADAATI